MGMNRARKFQPQFFTSEDVLALPIPARLTFLGLWAYVDDYGNGDAREALIKAAIWPEDDEISADGVIEHLLLIAERDMIRFYQANGRRYFTIVNWHHQGRIDRKGKTNIPPPPADLLAQDCRDSVATPSRTKGGRDEGGVGPSGSEPGGEGAGPSRHPRDTPPDPFCPQHPDGTLTPCRACGNARLARKKWDDEHIPRFAAQEYDADGLDSEYDDGSGDADDD